MPLFSRLSEGELAELAHLVRTRRFGKNEVVFHEGDVGTGLYIVGKGEAKIVLRSPEGKEAIIGLRGPGDFFGELALLDDEPRSAHVIATEQSEFLVIPRSDFIQFITQHPQVAVSLLAALSRRLRSTTQLVHDSAFLDVRARLLKTLLDLVVAKGQTEPDGAVLLSVRQSDLADMVGATRESVNKWLRYYEKNGLLKVSRGKLVVTDPQRLRGEAL